MLVHAYSSSSQPGSRQWPLRQGGRAHLYISLCWCGGSQCKTPACPEEQCKDLWADVMDTRHCESFGRHSLNLPQPDCQRNAGSHACHACMAHVKHEYAPARE